MDPWRAQGPARAMQHESTWVYTTVFGYGPLEGSRAQTGQRMLAELEWSFAWQTSLPKAILAALPSPKSIFSRRNTVCTIWKLQKELFMRTTPVTPNGRRIGVIPYWLPSEGVERRAACRSASAVVLLGFTLAGPQIRNGVEAEPRAQRLACPCIWPEACSPV